MRACDTCLMCCSRPSEPLNRQPSRSVPLPLFALIALIALPPPTTALPLVFAVLPALLATVPTVVPVVPNLSRGMNPGHEHHTRRGWRDINHTRRWGRGIYDTGRAVIDRTRHTHMAVNLGMADARMHRHRRLHKHRVRAAPLHQSQTQQPEQGQWP